MQFENVEIPYRMASCTEVAFIASLSPSYVILKL